MPSKKSRQKRQQFEEALAEDLQAEPIAHRLQPPPLSTSQSSMLKKPHPLLIASLGNPGRQYQYTRHNAGHILLTALSPYLSYPAFSRSAPHAKGQISRGQDALLWQSPSYMNVSGPGVLQAWRQFIRDLDIEDRNNARLVVVHDELESPMGKIKLKKGGSAKGHNGLKSCKSSLGGIDFWRLSVGIGRPLSRESDEVADYVLKSMSIEEREELTKGVGDAATDLEKLALGS